MSHSFSSYKIRDNIVCNWSTSLSFREDSLIAFSIHEIMLKEDSLILFLIHEIVFLTCRNSSTTLVMSAYSCAFIEKFYGTSRLLISSFIFTSMIAFTMIRCQKTQRVCIVGINNVLVSYNLIVSMLYSIINYNKTNTGRDS